MTIEKNLIILQDKKIQCVYIDVNYSVNTDGQSGFISPTVFLSMSLILCLYNV